MISRPKIQTAMVAMLMLALACIYTYPLVLHFDQAIPFARDGDGQIPHKLSGDHLQVYYWFWLLKDNLLGSSELFTNPYEFNMPGGQVPQGVNMFPLSVLYVLLTPLGDVAAYNALVVLSFVLAGLFMFLLLRLWFGSAAAACLGAVVFALSPFRVSQMAGAHLNGFIFFLYPLVFYLVECSLRRQSLWAVIGAAAAILSVVLMEHHLTYYLFVLLGVYIPFRLLVWCRGTAMDQTVKPGPQWLERAGTRLGPGAAAATLAMAAVLPAVWFQAAVSFHQPIAFWSALFQTALVLYGYLFMGLFLLEAVVWDLLVPVGMRRTLNLVTVGALPLFLLLLYGLQWIVPLPRMGMVLAGLALSGALAIRAWFLWCQRQTFFQMVMGRILPGVVVHLRTLVPLALTAVVSVAYIFHMKSRLFTGSIVQGGRRLGEVALYTPHLEDILMRLNPLMERYLYLGVVPTTAALAAIVLLVFDIGGRRGRASSERLLSGPSQKLLTATSEEILSGLTGQAAGRQAMDADAARLAAFFGFILGIAYVLSLGLGLDHLALYELFFHHFPYFNYPRVPGRMMAVVVFSLAVLAGYALMRLGHLRPQARWLAPAASAVAVVLVAVDYHPFKPLAITRLYPNPIYETVRTDIGDGLLLELPLWPGDSHQSSLYEYYTTIDRIRRVNGYSPVVSRAYIETVYKPLDSLNQGFLDRSQVELLWRLNVRYITAHDNTDVFPAKVSPDPPIATVRRLQRSPYLEFVAENSHIYLFRLKSEDALEKEGQRS
jgi:hypothetical protein